MAIRTAQIHDPRNKAFIHSIDMVHRAAETLFASTSGFSIQFVEDVAFLNGIRLRFESGAYAAVRTLRLLFERQGLGGISIRGTPSREAVHRLILLVADAKTPGASATMEELTKLDIKVLGIQKFSERLPNVRVDRRIFAVQCYAKLILAVREHIKRVKSTQTHDHRSRSEKPPRLRAVRVIQDLVDLCRDRADFLLRLSANRGGADPAELAGANACVLAIACGHTAGFNRQSLVDLGVAGLFHHLDASLGQAIPTDATGAPAAIAQILSDGGIGRSNYMRTLVVAERPVLNSTRVRTSEAHPFSKLLGVVAAFGELTSQQYVWNAKSLGKMHPLDALAYLYNDTSRFDRRFVDLLINVLRAFPTGVRVILDNGLVALVHSHAGGSRWDRPVVRPLHSSCPSNVDLMVRKDSRFERRIMGTEYFVTSRPPIDAHLPGSNLPEVSESTSDLMELSPVEERHVPTATPALVDDLTLDIADPFRNPFGSPLAQKPLRWMPSQMP